MLNTNVTYSEFLPHIITLNGTNRNKYFMTRHNDNDYDNFDSTKRKWVIMQSP